MKKCTVDGCNKKHMAKGYCTMHYARLKRHGNVLKSKKTREQLFNSRIMPIPECGCWIWTGATVRDDYGCIIVDGKVIRAHRFSWQLHNGPIPKGLFVLHKCDTPSCVNPQHLFLGTQLDNIRDMLNKNRKKLKVLNSDVPHIVELYKYGFTQTEIAKFYNVSGSSIHDTIRVRSLTNR